MRTRSRRRVPRRPSSTSSRLQEWNFGTLDQRLDPDTWDGGPQAASPNVVGLLGIFLVVAAVATWRSPQRRFWLGMWLAAIGPLLVFTNLYFQHDYYLAAVSPAFAALIGLGVGFTLAPIAKRPLALVSASLVLLVLVYGSLELGRGYWLRIHGADDDPQVLPLARELESLTRTGDLVAYSGLAWSPAVPYYADRWGHMLVFENDAFSFDLVHDAGLRLPARRGSVDCRLRSASNGGAGSARSGLTHTRWRSATRSR